MDRRADLQRIEQALAAAALILGQTVPLGTEIHHKANGDPVTDADLAVDEALRRFLLREDDGWLSEETADDLARLEKRRVWIVDPIDGTKEFVKGIPEWSVSVGLVEDGRAVAGGILVPPTGQRIIGAIETGVELNGRSCRTRELSELHGLEILVSRSELGRGAWSCFEQAPFRLEPMGSVAHKLGLVAAGLADATWTLCPKYEWDVAAGSALVLAAGGEVWTPDGLAPRFNQRKPWFPGFYAAPAALAPVIKQFVDKTLPEAPSAGVTGH